MTLSKTCHASDMMEELEKQFAGLLQPGKLSEWRCFDVPLLQYEKLNLILKLKVAMLNE